MAGKIFINYRRSQDAEIAHQLLNALQQAFEPDQLFTDVASISGGQNFAQQLRQIIAECDVLLVIIGGDWTSARDSSGARRLDDAKDSVCAEIEYALEQGKLVIPVLVGTGRMPSREELPARLESLARQQALRLRHECFRSDVGILIKALEDTLQGANGRRKLQTQLQARDYGLPKPVADDAMKDKTDESKPGRIVISYRRKDSQSTTRAIFERLEREFGAASVFMDVKIPVGIDFRKHIDEVLNGCDVLIAVVGPKWLGRRILRKPRVFDGEDWVRLEVQTAIQRRVPVVPVLVDGASMPSKAQLPASIYELAYQNAARVDTGRDFSAHMTNLIDGVRRIINQSRTSGAAERAAVT